MKNKIIVEKILKYISKLLDYTKDIEYDAFINNSILVEACVFNLSQIGELANKIDKEFEEKIHLFRGEFCMVCGIKLSMITRV